MDLRKHELELVESLLEHLQGLPRASSDLSAAVHREGLIRESRAFEAYCAQLPTDRREEFERVTFRLVQHLFLWATIRVRLETVLDCQIPETASAGPR